jgi:pyruvate,water dikinase
VAGELPEVLSPVLDELWSGCRGAAHTGDWIVRSSSECEDLLGASFAGLFRSVVGVRDRASLGRAIASCWAALWDPSLHAYAARIGLQAPMTMALLVQPRLSATVGGVLMTRAQGRPGCLSVVLSAEGPQAVVDGGDAQSWLIERETAAVLASSGPALGAPADLALRLVEVAELSERLFGAPQQIEWLADGGQTWILQSRPSA